MGLTLRKAIPADASILRHWDELPHVRESGHDDDWNWDIELARDPEWRELLIAELNGKPIGFMQVIDPLIEDTHYWGDCAPDLRAIDIWIGEKDELGKGYGTLMMRQAFEICFKDSAVKAILIDPLVSNILAHRFYERLGFKFVEERTFEEDHCYIYQLTIEDWKKMVDK